MDIFVHSLTHVWPRRNSTPTLNNPQTQPNGILFLYTFGFPKNFPECAYIRVAVHCKMPVHTVAVWCVEEANLYYAACS